MKRAGLPLVTDNESGGSKELGKTDAERRREEADERKKWEATRTSKVGNEVSGSVAGSRSALSWRAQSTSSKPDLFLQNMDRRLDPQSLAEEYCWPRWADE